jgi:hypothetical protein
MFLEESTRTMKSTQKPQMERQIDTEADDFAQEVKYAVTHKGRELHPEQHEHKKGKKSEQPSTPWQID